MAFGVRLALVVVAALAAASGQTASAGEEGRFSQRAWSANRDVYQAILRHPFLTGLTDGSLEREAFVFYLVQDAHYLRDFAAALEAAADKAPKPEWSELLRTHARETLAEEVRMHDAIFESYGVSRREQASAEMAPEAFGYAKFILATAHAGSFGEAIASLLPCYWIYLEVGKQLVSQGSPVTEYQEWIDAYASEEYAGAVRAVIDIADEVAAQAGVEERERMERHFARSARYEWMFWDSSYHRRSWPPER